MNRLHISENMLRLRREKRVTQEEVALFLGVSKAAVSKWETGQCMPDIVLLPEIANYFGVSVDELIGYEPQLSKEQMQRIYKELAEKFAVEAFEEVFAESEALVKKYYACYPFLLQVCVLWLNHFMLAENAERQQEILAKIVMLCERIISNCKDVGICNDAIFMKAAIDLQRGAPEMTVEAIEDLLNPTRLVNQSEGLLLQAYMMEQNMDKADSYAQISMYTQLLTLVGTAGSFLVIHADDSRLCDITIERVLKLMETFKFDKLNQNSAAIFNYHAAVVKCMQKEEDKALYHLKEFVRIVEEMLSGEIALHGDSYFTRVDEWFEMTNTGTQAPRSRKLIIKSVKENLANPIFMCLNEREEFIRLKNILEAI